MTEQQLRERVVNTFGEYAGAKKGSVRHKELVDIYNSYLPHPAGYKLKYTDAWCAGSASAIAIKLGLTDIVPVECSCSRQIALWKKLGRWVENENIVPKVGMYCYYDWDDGKDYEITDNTGAPEHVGIVASVKGNTFRVIEGNKGTASVVGYRDVKVNGRYLRGFGDPDYASKASSTTEAGNPYKEPTVALKLGRGTSENVKWLQWELTAHGYVCDIDGSFGPATDHLVRKFQKDSGLVVDGSVGPATRAALKK